VTGDASSASDVLKTELIDVTGFELSELESLDGSVLADCLRRFKAEAVVPGGSLAGFQAVL
jgi:hypothetical protein